MKDASPEVSAQMGMQSPEKIHIFVITAIAPQQRQLIVLYQLGGHTVHVVQPLVEPLEQKQAQELSRLNLLTAGQHAHRSQILHPVAHHPVPLIALCQLGGH
jgi:hypothetical protein